jgi:acyl-CoA dehydrogenase
MSATCSRGCSVAGTEPYEYLRRGVREVCARFPDAYWRELDARREYPEEFVGTRTEAGYLGALIPEEYGGLGLDLVEASIFLEEINRSGGNAQPAHAQVYTMGTLLRHGSEEQKREVLPKIASGEIRLQAFGVTEPEAGTDTTSLSTTGRRSPDGDRYVVNGRKMYISRVRHSDYMILLARTTPRDRVERKSEGLSVFIFDLREAVGNGLTVKPRRVMINNETNELLFEDLEIPASGLIGEEGKGFRYVIDGMNAERILIAAECIGNGRWFVEKATRRATEREVFGRPIGQN